MPSNYGCEAHQEGGGVEDSDGTCCIYPRLLMSTSFSEVVQRYCRCLTSQPRTKTHTYLVYLSLSVLLNISLDLLS